MKAFASASCAVAQEVGIPHDRFNLHGGAVSLGHPLGSSGSRCLITLLGVMRRLDATSGIVTLCLGGQCCRHVCASLSITLLPEIDTEKTRQHLREYRTNQGVRKEHHLFAIQLLCRFDSQVALSCFDQEIESHNVHSVL